MVALFRHSLASEVGSLVSKAAAEVERTLAAEVERTLVAEVEHTLAAEVVRTLAAEEDSLISKAAKESKGVVRSKTESRLTLNASLILTHSLVA